MKLGQLYVTELMWTGPLPCLNALLRPILTVYFSMKYSLFWCQWTTDDNGTKDA